MYVCMYKIESFIRVYRDLVIHSMLLKFIYIFGTVMLLTIMKFEDLTSCISVMPRMVCNIQNYYIHSNVMLDIAHFWRYIWYT